MYAVGAEKKEKIHQLLPMPKYKNPCTLTSPVVDTVVDTVYSHPKLLNFYLLKITDHCTLGPQLDIWSENAIRKTAKIIYF